MQSYIADCACFYHRVILLQEKGTVFFVAPLTYSMCVRFFLISKVGLKYDRMKKM